MKPTVIIIGSDGRLGTDLVKIFSGRYNIKPYTLDTLDITDSEKVHEIIARDQPFAVINAAAYNAVDLAEESEDEYKVAKSVNGEAVGFLADACKQNDSIFIHFSTDYVFDGKNKNGYPEDALTVPISNYGRSKLLGETLIKGKINKYYIIRTSRLFGPPVNSTISKSSFVELMLSLKEKEEIKAVDEEISAMTYTPDLAKATLDILSEKRKYGIYHIVNEGPCTWYQIAVEIFKKINVNIKLIPVNRDSFPRKASIPKFSYLNNTKYEKLRTWQNALSEYLNLYYNN